MSIKEKLVQKHHELTHHVSVLQSELIADQEGFVEMPREDRRKVEQTLRRKVKQLEKVELQLNQLEKP